MPSIISSLGLFAIAGFAAAQSTVQYNYPYTIDPQTVRQSDRDVWCNNEKAQCPLICLQQPGVETMDTIANDCDPDALTYSCICANNVSPNVTMYSLTLPYYICTEWGNQCAHNCGSDNTCVADCRDNHPCGAQNTKPGNSSLLSTTMSSTMAPTATAGNNAQSTTVPVDGFLGVTATSSPNGKGAASSTLNLGQSYGFAVIFAGVFAGFAMIL